MKKKIDKKYGQKIGKSIRSEQAIEIREVNADDRSIVHYASTKSPDSYGTVILPDAFNMARFSKNPIVLWAHNHRDLPVGKSIWQKADDNGLLVKTQFANTDFAQEVFQLFRDGDLKGWSIGFMPKNYCWDDSKEFEELVKQWQLADSGFDLIYTEVELFEYSAVPIPANPDSLTNALREGRIHSDVLQRDLGKMLEMDSDDSSQSVLIGMDELEKNMTELNDNVEELTSKQNEKIEQLETDLRKLISDLTSKITSLTRTVKALPEKKTSESPGNEIKTIGQMSQTDLNTLIQNTVQRTINKARGKLE